MWQANQSPGRHNHEIGTIGVEHSEQTVVPWSVRASARAAAVVPVALNPLDRVIARQSHDPRLMVRQNS